MTDLRDAGWPGGPDELGELLSALLDGELDPATEARVRAHVDASPEAGDELAALALVRTSVRDLPAVDPPFGFYENMLLEERRAARAPAARGRAWPKVVSAVAVAAAAVVVIVGITPATDAVVPPVTAFAARHEQMAAATDPTGTPPTTAPTTVAPTTTAAPTTISTVPPSAAAGMTFEAMPVDALDAMGAPPAMSHDMKRVGGYHGPDGVVHLMYANGALTLSIFEQVGTVAWDRLPAAGHTVQVGNDPAWTMDLGGEGIVVVARGDTVYTVVMAAPQDLMMSMAAELPPPPEASLVDRAQSACRTVVDRFSLTS